MQLLVLGGGSISTTLPASSFRTGGHMFGIGLLRNERALSAGSPNGNPTPRLAHDQLHRSCGTVGGHES